MSDSVYDVLVTSAVEYVTDIQYNMKLWNYLLTWLWQSASRTDDCSTATNW